MKLNHFQGPDGKARLLDRFEGRRLLIVYPFMREPGQDHPCEDGKEKA